MFEIFHNLFQPIKKFTSKSDSNLRKCLADQISSDLNTLRLHHQLDVAWQHGSSLGHDQAGNIRVVLHLLELKVILQLLPGDQVAQTCQVLDSSGR